MDDRGVSVAMLPVIVIGAIVAVASIAAILTYGVPESSPSAQASDGRSSPAMQHVEPPSGEAVVTALAHLRIVDSQGERSVPLSTWHDSIGPTWDAGEAICISGPSPCMQRQAASAVYLERPGASTQLV